MSILLTLECTKYENYLRVSSAPAEEVLNMLRKRAILHAGEGGQLIVVGRWWD
jgi:hypothetical protein